MHIKSRSMNWIVPTIVFICTVAMALGISTPQRRISALESTVQSLSGVSAQHSQDIAVMAQKLDDLTDGVNRLLDADGLQKIGKRK